MNTKYRKTVIAGNWKMNMLASEVKPFIDELKAAMPKTKTCETVLCVPAVNVPAMLKAGKEAKVACGAQDVSKFEKGASFRNKRQNQNRMCHGIQCFRMVRYYEPDY